LVLALVVLGATLSLAASMAMVDVRRRRAAESSLSCFARLHGHRFVAQRVEGESGLVPFVIDVHRAFGVLRTRATARAAHRRLPTIAASVGADGWTFAVGAAEGPEVRRLVSAEIDVLRESGPVLVASDGARVSISWSGAETSLAAHAAARDAVVALTTIGGDASPYRGA
jgi:hypothetical protein